MKRFLICTISPKGKIRVYKQLNGEEEVARLAARISACLVMQQEEELFYYKEYKEELEYQFKNKFANFTKEYPDYYELLELKDCLVIPYSSVLNFL